MAGPKTALLKGLCKEVARTIKEDSAYLAQGDPLRGSRVSGAAAWRAQPDAGRALARMQAALCDADPAALWAASTGRAMARFSAALTVLERRMAGLADAMGGGNGSSSSASPGAAPGAPAAGVAAQALGGAAPAAGQAGAPPPAARMAAAADEEQLRELYGHDGVARVGAPPASMRAAPHAPAAELRPMQRASTRRACCARWHASHKGPHGTLAPTSPRHAAA